MGSTWKRRSRTSDSVPELQSQIYDTGCSLFTIKMRHSGYLVRDTYTGGSIDYFDYCDPSQLSLESTHDMARALGCDPEWMVFYYNVARVDDCKNLDILIIEGDMRFFFNSVDSEKMVYIYVDTVSKKREVESNIPDKVPFGQDPNLEQIEIEELEKLMSIPEIIEVDNDDTESDVDSDSSSGDDEESDPNFVYKFEEHEYAKDDVLYDDNIDKEIEWTGFKHKFSSSCDATVQRAHSNLHVLTESRIKSQILPSTQTSVFPLYRGNADDDDFEFELTQCFKSPTEFREAIQKYATKQGQPVEFKRNDKDRIKVVCDCGWEIYAAVRSKNDSTFIVKQVSTQHTCTRASSSKHCTVKMLAQKYQAQLRCNPKWSVFAMQEQMEEENFTPLSLHKMYRIKKEGMRLNDGSEMDQYASLWSYCEELRNKNPNTTVKIICRQERDSGTTTFKRMYICWGALKQGWIEGCRPIIGIDGAHLKTSRGEVLLTAVGIDGNNSMYPIAYAMVLTENTKTWRWFLSLLIEDLGIKNSYHLTVISDKQKGLIKAIEEILPNSEHRFCVRHMGENFKKKFKGLPLLERLWFAASATRIVDFENHMEHIRRDNINAYEWLKERPAIHWARSHFSTQSNSDLLLNNLCESFNSVIGKARDKPIIVMLETLRLILMRRLHHQRDSVMKSSGPLCPKIQKILEEHKKNCFQYQLAWNGKHCYEVKGRYNDVRVVDLHKKTCSCKAWELTGIPCVHFVACINHTRDKVEDYTEHWYTKTTYIKAYTHMLQPINGRDEWPTSHCFPLVPWTPCTKKAGRPSRNARRKSLEELIEEKESEQKLKRGGTKYSCSNCGEEGHNKKGCKKPMKPKQDKPPVKRKRKMKEFPVQSEAEAYVQVSTNQSTTSSLHRTGSLNVKIYNTSSGTVVRETDGNSNITTTIYK